MTDILKGVRVVEVSAFVAAPLAGLTLAQMGAEVIRVDPPGGGLDAARWPLTEDGTSLYWAGLNKGKRSVTLDVRSDAGRAAAHRLMTAPGDGAGIVVTNLPARGWLDYEALRKLRDDLIMVSIVGNRDGTVAVDYTVNAATGFPFVTGPEGLDGPVNHAMPVWDVVAGLTAANAVLAALRHRERAGEGQKVQIALSDVAFAALSHLGITAEAEIGRPERPRLGNHIFGTFGCALPTLDGRWVMVAAVTPRHWRALVEATRTADAMAALAAEHGANLDDEADRFRLRKEIETRLAPWFAEHTLAEARAALDAAGACWGPYQTFGQAVAEDPRVSTDNPLFGRIDQPGIGSILAAGPAADFSAAPRGPVAPAPRMGADTEAVLREAGFSQTEIAEILKS